MGAGIWFMRHGDAVSADEAGSDHARRLSALGRDRVAATGAWLASKGHLPGLIWHSPLVRARETAELMLAAAGRDVALEEQTLLSPGVDWAAVFLRLKQRLEVEPRLSPVLLVGHQPDIGVGIVLATGGGQQQIVPGTIGAVEFASWPQRGVGSLKWFVRGDMIGS